MFSCQDNDEPRVDPPVPGENTDIIGNCLVHHIDLDNLETGSIPVSVADMLEIRLEDGSPVELSREVGEDGKVSLVPRVVGNVRGVKLVKAWVAPEGHRDMGRNFLLVVHGGNKAKAQEQDPLQSVYSSYIGKSTRCWAELGNSVLPVLDYQMVSELGEEYLNVNTTLNHEDMVELCGASYQQCMESWAPTSELHSKKSTPCLRAILTALRKPDPDRQNRPLSPAVSISTFRAASLQARISSIT